MKIIRRMYDWVLHWSATPYALPALFILSFAESSFFPIPPDVLLIAMTLAAPALWFRYAAACSVASVLGGMFGCLIGLKFLDAVGHRIVELYHLQDKFQRVGELFDQYQAWAVGAAGFTPLPYKVFTIAAGAFEINFPIFVAASLVSRSARFFLVAYLLHRFGPSIKVFIEKYFNLLTIAFFALLILGFILIKYIG